MQFITNPQNHNCNAIKIVLYFNCAIGVNTLNCTLHFNKQKT